ncbi:MAG: DUF5663 domain-containing protein [Candidatus Berkelbacteria bacterium]|nr:DUF5663 domain-containing protein [Candidatus Berkelbacteria bacterium]
MDYIDPQELVDKNIFELLDLKDAPEDKKKEIMDNMMQTVQNRVLSRILDALSDEDLKEFDKLTAENKTEEINKFLDGKGVNLAQISAEEALNYKTEIINQMAARDEKTAKQ